MNKRVNEAPTDKILQIPEVLPRVQKAKMEPIKHTVQIAFMSGDPPVAEIRPERVRVAEGFVPWSWKQLFIACKLYAPEEAVAVQKN